VLDTFDKVHDGWLDTGDLGVVSADGWLRLVGRAKDVIIRGGHNIDPLPIEQVLLTHPLVLDAGVVGRPDPRSGEVPMAFVVVRDPEIDLDELRRWAAERVHESAAAPTSICVLPALPLTAVGKPDKVALRVLATRTELAAALQQVGVTLQKDGAWCSAHDGAVQVRVALDDPSSSAAAERILSRYGLDWAITRPTRHTGAQHVDR
jgi:fatty-acyl-CoA synthase